jgi:hypothetical protein
MRGRGDVSGGEHVSVDELGFDRADGRGAGGVVVQLSAVAGYSQSLSQRTQVMSATHFWVGSGSQ